MDNEKKMEENPKHEFFATTALREPEKRKGVCTFLEIMVTFTSAVCLILSCLIAFPIVREAVNLTLFKGLITLVSFFIVHFLMMALTLSKIGVNTKDNSRVMVLIIIFDVAFWLMFALSFIVLSLYSH